MGRKRQARRGRDKTTGATVLSPTFTKLGNLVVLLLLAISAARADDFWKRKPSSQWTLAESLKLLRHSPWAHEEVLPVSILEEQASFSLPSGTRNCDPDAINANGTCMQQNRVENPIEASRMPNAAPAITPSWAVLVRWESVAPVKQAFARLGELNAKAAAEYQSPPASTPADEYVVTVKMVESSQPVFDPFAPKPDGKAEWQATLKTSRGTVPAARSEHAGAGASSALHFYFPRKLGDVPLVGPGVGQVEFILKGPKFTIKSKFTLDPDQLL